MNNKSSEVDVSRDETMEVTLTIYINIDGHASKLLSKPLSCNFGTYLIKSVQTLNVFLPSNSPLLRYDFIDLTNPILSRSSI